MGDREQEGSPMGFSYVSKTIFICVMDSIYFQVIDLGFILGLIN